MRIQTRPNDPIEAHATAVEYFELEPRTVKLMIVGRRNCDAKRLARFQARHFRGNRNVNRRRTSYSGRFTAKDMLGVRNSDYIEARLENLSAFV